MIEIVSNRFPVLANTLASTVETALDLGVATVISVADPITPVDTGALRANKVITKGIGSREITWAQHYAGYNEFGTIYMAATPFARPGLTAAEPVILNALAQFGGR